MAIWENTAKLMKIEDLLSLGLTTKVDAVVNIDAAPVAILGDDMLKRSNIFMLDYRSSATSLRINELKAILHQAVAQGT
uniref:Uncharacterized protein n=1 Tax=Romanomermis culicivorax TaxID=13658 RepID=A0A915J673_ROMCU